MAREKKTVECMTAGEINKTLDRLDTVRSKLNDEFIATGRGHETPAETMKMDDPLARRWKVHSNEASALRFEISRRYGPGAPSRLPPRGFGPINKAACKR